jgi:hypothetical protein
MEFKMTIALTAPMHGRHKTVKYCLKKNTKAGVAWFVYAATEDDDLELFDDDFQVITLRAANVISHKAQVALEQSKALKTGAVIMMGSDDYIDSPAMELIQKLLVDHDYISFEDCYFDDRGTWYRWPGYPAKHPRFGEPVGAGKVIRQDLLDRIDWKVWRNTKKGRVDYDAHKVLSDAAKSVATINCKRDGVKLVDVKDAWSKTPVLKFNYLERLR